MASSNIFISYAHPDDEPIPPGGLRWISNLHQALAVRLRQVLGTSPELWRDNLLNGNQYIWGTIEDELARGGLLVSVLTPSYVRSESCLRELNDYFRFSQQHGGVKIRDKSRIFKVVKFPFEEQKLPPELNQLLGYTFFRKNEKGQPRNLEPDLDPGDKRLFIDKLDDLVYDIQRLVDQIKQGDDAPPSRGVVYLAETPYDSEAKRDQLRRDLTDRGYTVLPDCRIPWDNPQFRDTVRSELARCQMSIHLIGASGGIVPEGDEQSITAVQAALAAEQSQARVFTRVVWMPDGIKPDKERYQQFIESLKTDRLPHSEILRGSLEELKAFVLERLEAKTPPVSPAITNLPRIYLVFEELDLKEVEPIRQFLFDQPGYFLLVIAVGDRPQQAHRYRLEFALRQRANNFARLIAVKRTYDSALRVDALVDLEGVAARNVGRRIVVAVIVRIVFAAFLEHQNVAEAACCQERGLGGRFGDHCIGGARRAVDQHVALAQERLAVELDFLRGNFNGRAHSLENALWRCQRLADGANAACVGDDDVRESAAAVDPEVPLR